jgi:uncharacterized membrane protein (UPF0127 family)
MQLVNTSKKLTLATNLEKAVTFWSRFVGLLNRNHLPDQSALWIESCNGIHTCFMRFSIDAVFVDKDLRVDSVFTQIKPWRFIWSKGAANSVIEFRGGRALELNIEVGDQLHVVH